MSSTSSNPEDGDTTEQSQLGLDTVIKVSEVAAPSVTPGEQVRRALLDRTLPGVQPHPAPSGARSTCACAQREGERAGADLQTRRSSSESQHPSGAPALQPAQQDGRDWAEEAPLFQWLGMGAVASELRRGASMWR